MTNGIIKTLMIGCGNIAGGLDIGKSGLPSTHAGAYNYNSNFDITACIDPDKTKLDKFSAIWEIRNAFLTIEEVTASNLDFDVVSICSPTHLHHKNVGEALSLNPKLIFCEKPLGNTYDEAVDIKNMCEKAGVLLAVNHTRRWDPKVIELRNKIANGILGEIRSVVCYYNKGVLNNGSHMIDLLLNLLGPLNVIMAFRAVNDYFKNDLTVSALLDTKSGIPVHLVGTHAADYAFFELEIIGSKKCITMRDGGLNWSSRKVIESTRFKGYKNLERDKYSKGKYFEAMINVVENIYNAIKKGEKLLCTGQDACMAQKICHDLLRIALLNNNNI